jgi:hypothetical protein
MQMSRKLKVANFMIFFSMVSSYATSFVIFFLIASGSERLFNQAILLSLAAFYCSAIYFYVCRKKYIAETLAGVKISANIALSIKYPFIRGAAIISCAIIFILFLITTSELEKPEVLSEAKILLSISFIQFYVAVSLVKLKSWIDCSINGPE